MIKRNASRRGFTLMEVIIAIVISALVATVASAALRAGIDVRERVNRHRVTVDGEARALEWLGTLLRHTPPASAVNEPLVQLSHQSNGSDSLTFLSQGVDAPAGTGSIWRVTLHTDAVGLHLNAVPVRGAAPPMESVLSHITTLRAEVLSSSLSNPEWLRDWPVLRSSPAALRLTLGLADGSSRAAMVFALSPLTAGAR